MNAKKLIAAVATVTAFAAANTAFAAEWVEFTDFKSSKSRAEVMAELRQSQDNGSYAAARQEAVNPAAGFTGTKTRAQVMAELEQSQADGTYAAMHQEYEGQIPGLNNVANTRTRFAGKASTGNTN